MNDERNEGAGAEPLPEDWREAALHYNRPPPTPRDEMWSAIEASLGPEAGKAGDATAGASGTSRSLRLEEPSRRNSPRGGRPLRWLLPLAAAAALVAVGIGIGRMTAPGVDSPGAASMADATGSSATARAGADGPEESPAMRAVAMDHLGRSESLLSMVRADARSGRVEYDLGGWAGSLLGDTRMLLDSPAAADPAMRDLLEDLELILAQVALLRGGGAMEEGRARSELSIIARGLEEQNVLSRIEAVLPAGSMSEPGAPSTTTGI